MSTNRLSQGIINSHSAFGEFIPWPKREVLRIEALSDQEVRSELESIMEGRNYSWHSINELMQAQLDKGALEFTPKDGDVLFEWNNLCDEKRNWERKRRFSFSDTEFHRDCLINLKIMPTKAGLGFEGSQLVSANLDKPDLLTKDLWVAPERYEDYENTGLSADDDSSTWDSEDFNEDDDEIEDDEYEEAGNSDSEYEEVEYSDSEYERSE